MSRFAVACSFQSLTHRIAIRFPHPVDSGDSLEAACSGPTHSID